MKPPAFRAREADANVIQYSSHPSDSPVLENTLMSHPFNMIVAVFVPEAMHLDQNIKNIILDEGDYYIVWDVPVYRFIEKTFIDAFIKKGELTLLTPDVKVEIENCCGITPNGILALSLTYNTYMSLGISESSSVKVKKLTEDKKYYILIDLKSPTFVPGNNSYNTLLEKLKNAKDFMVDFNAIWEPPPGFTSTTFPNYFYQMGLEVTEYSIQERHKVEYNVKIPKNRIKSSEEFFNWFAAHHIGLSEAPEEGEGEHIDIPDFGPEDMTQIGQSYLVAWMGVIPTSRVLMLYKKLKEYLAERPSVPFIGLHVQGFDDSPISFGNQAHRNVTNGDNDVTYIIQNDGITRMCKNHTPHHP